MSDPRAPDETVDSPALSARAPVDDPQSIGPFRILERIGEGGMGVIYKAEQRSPVRRIVALKVIKLGMDTREVLARFEAERQALALMSHPNIARVLDAGATETGRPYFAMEFVAGVPLTRYCDEQRLATRQRLELFAQICQAVQHAHQKGIIHRDLKPTNILVTLIDGKPVPKVIDFGIAKATAQMLTAQTLYTQTGALIGTPEYMSPEQAQTSGLDVDTRTDIYSLGVILYELLTGTLPFDSRQLRSAGFDGMARMIKETEPQKPSTRLLTVASAGDSSMPAASARREPRDTRSLQRELRGDLDWIVLKAMEKDRTRRYETAAALARDIDHHLNNEPVNARPPSTRYRVEKFVRRHKGTVIAACAVAVALLLGIVGTTLGLLHAREQRDLAIEQKKAADAARESVKTSNLFLSDLLISFSNPVVGKTGVARAVKRLDEGWLKDQPDALLSSRIILGMFYIQENDGAAAEKQFDAVIALSRRPDGTIPADISGVIHSGRGMALWMKKNLPEAEHELRAAIDDYRSVPGMGAKVAQLLFGLSAVRQAQGDGDEAQKLLAEATHIAASEPTMRGYVAGSNLDRDDWPAPEPTNLLKAGKFVEARKAFETAVQSDAANHWNWYYLSCLDLYLGDVPAYQDAARQMLQHFGGTAVNTIAERTAKVCLLTPQPVGELKKLLQLTQAAMSSDPKDDTYPWFALSNALAAYRAGEYEAALTSLDKSTSLKPPAARATIELLHAMISHQLKQPDQASHFLQAAITCIDSEMAKPGAVPLNSPENWLICHILRREAEQLITGKFTATSATQPRK